VCLAVPGRITRILGQDLLNRTGTVDFGGASRAVDLAFVPEAREGDYVIVHVGLAIAVLDPEEAARSIEAIAALDAGVPPSVDRASLAGGGPPSDGRASRAGGGS
jgi:hydrogenase expression/formation protein HypC